MNLSNPPHSLKQNEDKWQQMLAIVNQQASLHHPEGCKQFKKLCWMRFITENCLLFLLQYIGLMFSSLVLYPAPLAFASGTACAFIFMRGASILPGIWLGSLLAYGMTDLSFTSALVCATLLTLQPWLLLKLCYRYITPTLVFYHRKEFLQFMIVCGFLTGSLSFIMALVLKENAWQIALANFNGIVIIACALSAWDAYFPQVQELKSQITAVGFLYGLLFVSVLALAFSHQPDWIMVFTFLTFLFTMISMYWGWCGMLASLFLTGLLLALTAYLRTPLFAMSDAKLTLPFLQQLLSLEMMLGLMLVLKPKKNVVLKDYIR